MTTLTYRHAGPATECETCDSEYLCSDCYIPDPQGNFQTPGD
jgi:hypothetical protein